VSGVRRLDQELADALGLAQAVRHAVGQALDRGAPPKLARRLAEVDAHLAGLQERLNAIVVADPDTRGRLTGRSRQLRDAEHRLGPDADLLDALQALAAESAYAVAQWRVLERLAKGAGDAEARALVRLALPAAEGHLELAFKACEKAAKREARAVAAS
jgi:hypothetical protein